MIENNNGIIENTREESCGAEFWKAVSVPQKHNAKGFLLLRSRSHQTHWKFLAPCHHNHAFQEKHQKPQKYGPEIHFASSDCPEWVGWNRILTTSCKGVWKSVLFLHLGLDAGHQSTTIMCAPPSQPLRSKGRIQTQVMLLIPTVYFFPRSRMVFLTFSDLGSLLSGTCLQIFLVSKFAFTYYPPLLFVITWRLFWHRPYQGNKSNQPCF